MAAELSITGLSFFMPIFSFLFVFIIIYAVLAKTKLLGENQFVNLFISFIVAIIFISFSSANFSTENYIRTIVPWFAVLFVSVFLILLLAGLASKDLGKIMTSKFAWVIIGILIVVFVIAAIRVFNPVFSAQYGVTSGDSPQALTQIWDFFKTGWGGGLLVIIIALVIAWIVARFK